MRLLLPLALTACGRLGFGTDPSHIDAPPVDISMDDAARASCPGMTDVADEDGDLVGDPCDVCPHVADAAQADGDGDRVGDGCDPEPGLARQQIRFFQPFNAVLPEWDSNRPIIAGQLVVDVPATDHVARLEIPTSTSVLQVAGTITTIGDVAFPPQVFIGTSPVADDLYYAELILDAGERRRSLMHALNTVFTEYDGVREAAPIEPGPFMMSLAIGNDRIDAVIETAGAAPARLTATGTGTVAGMRGVLYVAAMTVAIDYVIQIETN